MADPANMNRLSRRGFTLVELAIVLVIVGLLVGLGSSMTGMLITANNVRQTKDSLDAVSQSITSWASANNRLPDVTTGTTGFKSVVKTPTDAWGRDFIYLYDTNLAPGSATKDTICGRRTTSLSVITSEPTATISNVAFVVISKGDDATLETTVSDAALSVSRAATGTVTASTSNSDLLRWVTLDELRSKIGCQGAPLKIVNNELPFGSIVSNYSAKITADGGGDICCPR